MSLHFIPIVESTSSMVILHCPARETWLCNCCWSKEVVENGTERKGTMLDVESCVSRRRRSDVFWKIPGFIHTTLKFLVSYNSYFLKQLNWFFLIKWKFKQGWKVKEKMAQEKSQYQLGLMIVLVLSRRFCKIW